MNCTGLHPLLFPAATTSHSPAAAKPVKVAFVPFPSNKITQGNSGGGQGGHVNTSPAQYAKQDGVKKQPDARVTVAAAHESKPRGENSSKKIEVRSPQKFLAEKLNAPQILTWDARQFSRYMHLQKLDNFRSDVIYTDLSMDGENRWERLKDGTHDFYQGKEADYSQILPTLAHNLDFGPWSWNERCIMPCTIGTQEKQFYVNRFCGMSVVAFEFHHGGKKLTTRRGSAMDSMSLTEVTVYLDLFVRMLVEPSRAINYGTRNVLFNLLSYYGRRNEANGVDPDHMTLHTTVREAWDMCWQADLFKEVIHG